MKNFSFDKVVSILSGKVIKFCMLLS